jgi:hypothetical protein
MAAARFLVPAIVLSNGVIAPGPNALVYPDTPTPVAWRDPGPTEVALHSDALGWNPRDFPPIQVTGSTTYAAWTPPQELAAWWYAPLSLHVNPENSSHDFRIAGISFIVPGMAAVGETVPIIWESNIPRDESVSLRVCNDTWCDTITNNLMAMSPHGAEWTPAVAGEFRLETALCGNRSRWTGPAVRVVAPGEISSTVTSIASSTVTSTLDYTVEDDNACAGFLCGSRPYVLGGGAATAVLCLMVAVVCLTCRRKPLGRTQAHLNSAYSLHPPHPAFTAQDSQL